ncbi:MAG: zinc dependent phospholipase C family protein [Promethearchaeia archaeon]
MMRLKKRKKYYTRFLIGALFTIIFLSNILYVNAWNNGSYAYNKTDYDYETDYATHDWIAEHALDQLIKEDESNWQWLNQAEMKKIFLLGTEAPDNSEVETTLDGEKIEGFGDRSKHHIYFYEDGEVLEDDAALLAKKWGNLADAHKEEGKKEQAAFYLGAMTHYIADMSMYAHIAQNNNDERYPGVDFDGWETHEQHSKVEGRVGTRTNDYEDRDEFFELGSIDIGKDKNPYDIAVDLAWETYADESHGGAHDAKWLHENFFSDWAANKDDRDNDNSTQQAYYDRTEVLLTEAVESIASAMAYIGGVSSSGFDPMWIIGIIVIVAVIAIPTVLKLLN